MLVPTDHLSYLSVSISFRLRGSRLLNDIDIVHQSDTLFHALGTCCIVGLPCSAFLSLVSLCLFYF